MKKIIILSIDGGGIRGIIAGEIIKAIEIGLQEKTNTKKCIGDFIDFAAGTSTGGIMASAYIVPNDKREAKYSAEDIQKIYTKNGKKIFNSTTIGKWLSYIYDETYDAQGLEEELNIFFGETLLSELIKPCLITSYDIEARNAKLFTSHSIRNGKDFFVKDVVRATSAAPTYFEPAKIRSIDGTLYHLVDGGMYANNPAMCAYAEIRNMSKFDKKDVTINNPMAKNMLIISIGTGSVKKPYRFSDVKDNGKVAWITPIIDILMSANAETVNFQLRKLFDTLSTAKNRADYIRIEPGLSMASSEMDDVSPENIENLIKDGQIFVQQNEDLIKRVVDRIIDNL